MIRDRIETNQKLRHINMEGHLIGYTIFRVLDMGMTTFTPTIIASAS